MPSWSSLLSPCRLRSSNPHFPSLPHSLRQSVCMVPVNLGWMDGWMDGWNKQTLPQNLYPPTNPTPNTHTYNSVFLNGLA